MPATVAKPIFLARDGQIWLGDDPQSLALIALNTASLLPKGKIVACDQAPAPQPPSIRLFITVANDDSHDVFTALIADLPQVLENRAVSFRLFKRVLSSATPISKISAIHDGVFASARDGTLYYSDASGPRPTVHTLVGATGASGPMADIVAAKNGITTFLSNLLDALPKMVAAVEQRVGQELLNAFGADIKAQQKKLGDVFNKPLSALIQQTQSSPKSAFAAFRASPGEPAEHAVRRLFVNKLEINRYLDPFAKPITFNADIPADAPAAGTGVDGDSIDALGKLFQPLRSVLDAKNTLSLVNMGAEDLLGAISGSKSISDVLNDVFNIFKIDQTMSAVQSILSGGQFSVLLGKISLKDALSQPVDNAFFNALYDHYYPGKKFTVLDLAAFMGALFGYVAFAATGKTADFHSVFSDPKSLNELTSCPDKLVQAISGTAAKHATMRAAMPGGAEAMQFRLAGTLPTVTAISPNFGPIAGGTEVTITGTDLTGATAVKFGAHNASSFKVNSATSVTATSPEGSAGPSDVTVTTAGGTSATAAVDQFTYVPEEWRVAVACTFSALTTLGLGTFGALSLGTGVIESSMTGGIAAGVFQCVGGIIKNNGCDDAKWDFLGGFVGAFAGALVSSLIGKAAANWANNGTPPTERLNWLKLITAGVTLTLGGGGGAVVSSVLKNYAKSGKVIYDDPLALTCGAIGGFGGGAMGCALHFMGGISGSSCLPVPLTQAEANNIEASPIFPPQPVLNNAAALPGAAAGWLPALPNVAMGVYTTGFNDGAAVPQTGRSIALVKNDEFLLMAGSYAGHRERLFWLESGGALPVAPAVNRRADLVIGVHAIGRYVFANLTHAGPVDFTRPMYKTDFANFLLGHPWVNPYLNNIRLGVGVPARSPIIKLLVCFSALPICCFSLGQELATTLNATVYGGRPPVFPYLDIAGNPEVPWFGWVKYTP